MAKRRGRGFAAVNYPTGMNLGGDPSQALIHATTTGNFVVTLSSVDLGQGIKTIAAQCAAETLGLPYENILVDTADTDTGPHCMGTFASRGTHRVGNAVIMAAKEAREVMLQVAADELEVDPDDLETDGTGFVRLKGSEEKKIHIVDLALAAHFKQGKTISGRGMFLKELSVPVPETGEMDPDSCQAHACTVAEVEVDDETGVVDVLAMYNVYEVGRALEPGDGDAADRGRRVDGHLARAVRGDRAVLPGARARPDRLLRVPDAGPRRQRGDAERDHRAARGERPVRRQGDRRDDRERPDPRDRQRDLRRGRRAARVDAVHAGEGAARARRAGGGPGLMVAQPFATDAGAGSVEELGRRFAAQRYFADEGLLTAVHLALVLGRPLALEGEPGVGKTELAKVLAAVLGRELIRLQCYEGLDAAQALYEWDYPRQLLAVRVAEAEGKPVGDLYDERYLLERPLLKTVRAAEGAVLLIDEIDRSDSEFEAFLLEFLSDFQITIPEVGTLRAPRPPVVVLTSNRTRELHDALKRRCLYHWIPFPDAARERAILQAQAPGLDEAAAGALVEAIKRVRGGAAAQAPGDRGDDRLGAGRAGAGRGGDRVAGGAAPLARAAAQGAGGRRARRRARPGPLMPEPRLLAREHLHGFLRALEDAGVAIAPPKKADFLVALVASPPDGVEALYWRARVTLVGSAEDFEPLRRGLRGVSSATGGCSRTRSRATRPRSAARRRRRPARGRSRSTRSSRARARASTPARRTSRRRAASATRRRRRATRSPIWRGSSTTCCRRSPRGGPSGRGGDGGSICGACSRRPTARAARSSSWRGGGGRRGRAGCSC